MGEEINVEGIDVNPGVDLDLDVNLDIDPEQFVYLSGVNDEEELDESKLLLLWCRKITKQSIDTNPFRKSYARNSHNSPTWKKTTQRNANYSSQQNISCAMMEQRLLNKLVFAPLIHSLLDQ